MAGPRPDDNYNPNQTVAPQAQPGNDYLSIRSNPNQFGANIGQAVEGFGKQTEQAGQNQFQIEMQKQGLANEHAANQAEIKSIVDGGELETQFKNLKGLEAYGSKDQYIQQYLKQNEQIRTSLGNPMAQKAFDQLINRRVGFTVQGMNDYAHSEKNSAYRQGTEDSAQLSLNRAGTYEVASSPAQLDFEKGNVIHQANTQFTAPEYGLYQNTPVKQNPQTGLLEFDQNTPQGKAAQNHYDNYMDQKLGKFYENAIHILGNDPLHGNWKTAVEFYKQHEADIPASIRSTLSAQLSGPYHNEINRDYVEGRLSQEHQTYLSNQTTPDTTSYATNLGNVKTKDGSFANPMTPADGATLAANNLRGGLYDGKTVAQIGQTWTGESPEKAAAWAHNVQAASGIDVNTVPDLKNPDVVKSLLRGIALAEKSPQDRGAFNDNVISQGVSNSFSGVKANLAQGRAPTLNGRIHQSEADYLSEHENDLVKEARDSAYKEGFDSIVADQRGDRMRARIAEERTFQNNEVRSLTDSIYTKVADPDHPVTSMSFLDNSPDPAVKQAWARLQFLDPYKASTVQRVVNANAAGKTATYGTDFYTHYNDILTGKVTSIDQLQDYLTGNGDHAPLTPSGLKAINEELKFRQTPQGQGFTKKEQEFLEQTHGWVTGSKVFPGINPALLQDSFDKEMLSLVPQMQAKRADLVRQGKDPSVMFDPNDKENYIGKNVKPADFDKLIKALVTSSITDQNQGQTNPVQAQGVQAPQATHAVAAEAGVYKTIEDVGNAYASGKIKSKDEVRDIIQKQFGGFAPKVPLN